jgi:hypothetical protein
MNKLSQAKKRAFNLNTNRGGLVKKGQQNKNNKVEVDSWRMETTIELFFKIILNLLNVIVTK